jgi:transcription elongation factor GreA
MKHKLTQQDIKEIQEELDYRKLVVRPQALEEVKETRAHGDLSENFEYHEAKKVKNRNDGRIRYLERMLKTSEIMEEDTSDDRAGVNKTITIYIPEDDVEEVYTLVSTMREDPMKGLISVESPMGKALLGKRAGDTSTVRVNKDYSYAVEIRKVEITDAAEKSRIRKYLAKNTPAGHDICRQGIFILLVIFTFYMFAFWLFP